MIELIHHSIQLKRNNKKLDYSILIIIKIKYGFDLAFYTTF